MSHEDKRLCETLSAMTEDERLAYWSDRLDAALVGYDERERKASAALLAEMIASEAKKPVLDPDLLRSLKQEYVRLVANK